MGNKDSHQKTYSVVESEIKHYIDKEFKRIETDLKILELQILIYIIILITNGDLRVLKEHLNRIATSLLNDKIIDSREYRKIYENFIEDKENKRRTIVDDYIYI